MSKLEHTSWQDGLLEHERPSILDFIFFERGIVELSEFQRETTSFIPCWTSTNTLDVLVTRGSVKVERATFYLWYFFIGNIGSLLLLTQGLC